MWLQQGRMGDPHEIFISWLKDRPLREGPLPAMFFPTRRGDPSQHSREPHENPAANPATSTIIPAGHAASTAEGEVGEHRANASTGLAGLSVAALGVIFGDIGTSPVYTFRECFNPEHRLALDAAHVLGVLSLIF